MKCDDCYWRTLLDFDCYLGEDPTDCIEYIRYEDIHPEDETEETPQGEKP